MVFESASQHGSDRREARLALHEFQLFETLVLQLVLKLSLVGFGDKTHRLHEWIDKLGFEFPVAIQQLGEFVKQFRLVGHQIGVLGIADKLSRFPVL